MNQDISRDPTYETARPAKNNINLFNPKVRMLQGSAIRTELPRISNMPRARSLENMTNACCGD